MEPAIEIRAEKTSHVALCVYVCVLKDTILEQLHGPQICGSVLRPHLTLLPIQLLLSSRSFTKRDSYQCSSRLEKLHMIVLGIQTFSAQNYGLIVTTSERNRLSIRLRFRHEREVG